MQLLIMKQDKPPHYKGDIVEIRATGTPFGGKEPDAFVLVEVDDAPISEFEGRSIAWECQIDFSVVSHDAANDKYRLKLYSTTANNGLGEIAKEDVEAFIQNWNGTVVDYATNEVTFDLSIFDALTSPAFWEVDVSSLVFTETAYNQDTGLHTIELDYSAIDNNPTYVEMYVKRMGLAITNHSNKILTYEADTSTVNQAFQSDLKEKTNKRVARRRYHVSESVVDTIVDNGGTYTTDLSTLRNYIMDKASE